VKRGLVLADTDKSLWPAPYDEATAEAACAFIFDHVYTFEETSGEATRIPRKDYLVEVAKKWHWCRDNDKPFHILKSRRLIVSWFIGALELHLAGVRTTKVGILAAQFEGVAGSKGFVWRAHYMYDQLRRRNPDWKLPEATTFGNAERKQLEQYVLANGSTFEPINSDGGKVRGSGFGVARAEELSAYPYVAETWGQVRTIVAGPPGQRGGLAVSVSNASPDEDYHKLCGVDL